MSRRRSECSAGVFVSSGDNSPCFMLGDAGYDGAFKFSLNHQFRRDVRCVACFSNKLKSAVFEAGHGNASRNRRDWALDIDPGVVDESAILDILICQNRDCGKYCVVSFARLAVRGGVCLQQIDGKVHTKDLERRRRRIQQILSNEKHPILPARVANLVMDHVMAAPGSFAHEESARFRPAEPDDSNYSAVSSGVHVVSRQNGPTVYYSYTPPHDEDLE